MVIVRTRKLIIFSFKKTNKGVLKSLEPEPILRSRTKRYSEEHACHGALTLGKNEKTLSDTLSMRDGWIFCVGKLAIRVFASWRQS